jgi:hypothetical protein
VTYCVPYETECIEQPGPGAESGRPCSNPVRTEAGIFSLDYHL